MKIYPQEHELVKADKVEVKDIPLAYIDTSENTYQVKISIPPEYRQESSRAVMPYEEFADPDTYLFDSSGTRLDYNDLKRLGNRYYYEPAEQREFTPEQFSCNILMQRDMGYSSQDHIDLKIAASTKNLEERLLPVFGDAWRYFRAPQNIKANGGSMLEGSMTYSDLSEADFVFMDSYNGLAYKQEDGVSAAIDYNALLDSHTNIWLSVETFGDALPEMTSDTEGVSAVVLSRNSIYSSGTYQVPDGKKMRGFIDGAVNPDFPESEYEYDKIGNSVLILHKDKKGFIIVVPCELTENAMTYSKLIYEVLTDVYCRSYYDLSPVQSWITDEPVDYVSYQPQKFNRNHGEVRLDRILAECSVPHKEPYLIRAVTCYPSYVLFTGMGHDNRMNFLKISQVMSEDISKASGEVSYYTTKKTVIVYKQEDINLLETIVSVTSRIDSRNTITLSIAPCSSSAHKIYRRTYQELEIPNNTRRYYICFKEQPIGFQTEFELVDTEAYNESCGSIIATIDIACVREARLYDLRTMGGGLSEAVKDDYDMLDIGHPLGRPYRHGGSVVIRLPQKCYPHKEKIEDALRKHIASGDYPIIVYDEEED